MMGRVKACPSRHVAILALTIPKVGSFPITRTQLNKPPDNINNSNERLAWLSIKQLVRDHRTVDSSRMNPETHRPLELATWLFMLKGTDGWILGFHHSGSHAFIIVDLCSAKVPKLWLACRALSQIYIIRFWTTHSVPRVGKRDPNREAGSN